MHGWRVGALYSVSTLVLSQDYVELTRGWKLDILWSIFNTMGTFDARFDSSLVLIPLDIYQTYQG